MKNNINFIFDISNQENGEIIYSNIINTLKGIPNSSNSLANVIISNACLNKRISYATSFEICDILLNNGYIKEVIKNCQYNDLNLFEILKKFPKNTNNKKMNTIDENYLFIIIDNDMNNKVLKDINKFNIYKQLDNSNSFSPQDYKKICLLFPSTNNITDTQNIIRYSSITEISYYLNKILGINIVTYQYYWENDNSMSIKINKNNIRRICNVNESTKS